MNRLIKAVAAGAAMVFAGTAQADTEMVGAYEWTYELVNGKTATITGSDFWLAGTVEIPSKLGGKPVTAIGPDAFYRRNFLGVTIPSGVTEISTNAFNDCAYLRAVKIPDTVTTIGPSAFSKCVSLVCVDFGKKANAIGENVFTSCPKLETLVFRGNAPTDVSDQDFTGVAEGCSVYVSKSAKNWPAAGETWQGLPVVVGDKLVKVSAESSDEAFGTVSGGGEFAIGKKVTFKAKANKNCVFGGWVACGTEDVLSYSTTYAYTVDGYHVGDDPLFTAKFNTNDILFLELPYKTTAWDGYVNLNMLGHVRSYSEPKLTFKGLPSGVKYDAKTFKLSGQAKTPGEYKVDLKVSNASKMSESGSFFIVVPNHTDGEIPIRTSFPYGPFVPGVAYVENIADAAGCKVTGLPAGMKWTDKAITDKTLGDIPAYSAYGTPTKPGSYTVFFTKTTEDKKKHEATATFKVGEFPKLTIKMSGNTGKDSVKGDGAYAANAKVSLKATADTSAKNASEKKVFSCWKNAKGEILSREASYSYVMPSVDTTLTAEFITAEEDANNITAKVDDVSVAPFDDNLETVVTLPCGVLVDWPLQVEALSQAAVKVSGLPAGMKFTAKDIVDAKTKDVLVPANTIYGAPTAASKTKTEKGMPTIIPSEVKIEVTTAGKTKKTYVITAYVEAMQPWAVGTFYGGDAYGGLASITVANTGKISGKRIDDAGTSETISATEFNSYKADDCEYETVVSTKRGTSAGESDMTLTAMGTSLAKIQLLAYDECYLYAAPWKTEPWKTLAKKFTTADAKTLEIKDVKDNEGNSGSLTLQFDASGSVKAKGVFGKYSASCSSAVTPITEISEPTDEFDAYLYVSLPAKKDKFAGYSAKLELHWNGTAFSVK